MTAENEAMKKLGFRFQDEDEVGGDEKMHMDSNLAQLQLAAMKFDGTIESQLMAAAVAVVVSRMAQLDEADLRDLFACVKDITTIKTPEDAEDTIKTILEILKVS